MLLILSYMVQIIRGFYVTIPIGPIGQGARVLSGHSQRLLCRQSYHGRLHNWKKRLWPGLQSFETLVPGKIWYRLDESCGQGQTWINWAFSSVIRTNYESDIFFSQSVSLTRYVVLSVYLSVCFDGTISWKKLQNYYHLWTTKDICYRYCSKMATKTNQKCAPWDLGYWMLTFFAWYPFTEVSQWRVFFILLKRYINASFIIP